VRRSRQWTRRNPVGAVLILSLCLGLSAALTLLKVVNDHRREVELDRDEAFEEGMRKIGLIWQEPDTRAVTISARELAILAGRSPTAWLGPGTSSVSGQRQRSPLRRGPPLRAPAGSFQQQLERELGKRLRSTSGS